MVLQAVRLTTAGAATRGDNGGHASPFEVPQVVVQPSSMVASAPEFVSTCVHVEVSPQVLPAAKPARAAFDLTDEPGEPRAVGA